LTLCEVEPSIEITLTGRLFHPLFCRKLSPLHPMEFRRAGSSFLDFLGFTRSN
jgi:hypothetical protein